MFRRMLIAGAILGLFLGMLQGVVTPVAIAAQGTPCAVDSKETITALVTDFKKVTLEDDLDLPAR